MYQQASNSSLQRRVCIVMRTACSTPITNRPRMRSIGSLARSTESASSVSIHVHFRGTLNCSILSVDKKRNFSRKRANEDEGDITYINERNRVFNKKASLLPQCHAMSYLIAGFLPDCSILRQIHSGDSGKLRARNCVMIRLSSLLALRMLYYYYGLGGALVTSTFLNSTG